MVDKRFSATIPADVPYIKWFEGKLSKIFIIPNPFYKLESTSPTEIDFHPNIIMRNDYPDLDIHQILKMNEKDATSEPTLNDYLNVKNNAEIISWNTIITKINLPDIWELHRVLLTNIEALKAEYQNKTGEKELRDFCEKEEIFIPAPYSLEASIEKKIGEILLLLKIKDIIAVDEFGDNEEILQTVQFLNSKYSVAMNFHANGKLYDQNEHIFYHCPHDSFYGVLGFSEKAHSKIKPETFFEGFYADETISAHWGRLPRKTH